MYELQTIPLTQIHLDRNQPRETLKNIDELSSSISAVGLKHIIQVQPTQKKDGVQQYQVQDGARRFTAITKLGWQDAQFLVAAKLKGAAKLMQQTVANFLRDDLTITEELKTYVRLRDSKELDMSVITKGLGKTEATFEAGLPILTLPEEIQKAVDAGTFTKGSALHLATEIPEEHWEGAYAAIGKATTDASRNSRMTAYVTEQTADPEEQTDMQKEHPKTWKNNSKTYKSFAKFGKKILADGDLAMIVDANRDRLADFKEELKNLAKTVANIQAQVIAFEAKDSTKE